jgi:hypothetical protein
MMIAQKYVKVGGLIALLMALVLLPAIGQAQEAEENDIEEDGSYCDRPQASYLTEELGFDCELMAEGGVGLGEIKKAWLLSQSLPGFEGDWEYLLAQKKEGFGWGQLKKAAWISDGDPKTIERYLALRANDVGWGQISQVQALADAEILDFDVVMGLFLSDKGWGDIKTELGFDGPPPWAGGKNKANDGSPDDEAGGKAKGNGPPPWAQNDKASVDSTGER